MSLFKLSRNGVRMLKELFIGNSLLVTKASHVRGPFFKYLRTLGRGLNVYPHVVKFPLNWICHSHKFRCFKVSNGRNSDCILPQVPRMAVMKRMNQKKQTVICRISVTFVLKDGEEQQIEVPVGMSMLEAAHQNDIELEGACEGSLACSTCHVIVMDMDYYNKIEEPVDEENDMLDLAFGLTETSRLGCQVIAKPELDGIRLAIPAATRNFAVDGFTPKPH